MPRPALVIGLGGTGQWVLTYLKKTLLETYQGVIPEVVRLIAFDTMPEPEAAARAGVAQQQKSEIRIGNVQLIPNQEFIPLVGNALDFSDEILQGQHPHISSWFDVQYYRNRVMPTLWDLSAGAAQLRQFGRLALFMRAEVIWERLREKVQDLVRIVNEDNKLEIAIVASFAGGTGAGMFIDMGILARKLADEIRGNEIIRGFFVLPYVFGTIARDRVQFEHMEARAFAVWRELDRFMSMGTAYGTHVLTYMKGNPELEAVEVRARPFDVCYIVDSRRPKRSLAGERPEDSVFPLIAEFIASVIDGKAGRKYTEYITTNVAGIQAQLQVRTAEPRYSAFSAYTVKAPVYYALQEAQYALVRDLLEEWLKPVRKNGEPVDVSRLLETSEPLPPDPRDAALDFLRSQSLEGYLPPGQEAAQTEKIANTLLLQRIGEIWVRRALDDLNILREDAEWHLAGFSEEEGILAGTYLAALVMTAGREYGETWVEIEPDIRAAFSLYRACPPSREFGDQPAEALIRFEQDIPRFFKEHFGMYQAGGAEVRGRFGSALDKSRAFQVRRFRELLRHWLLRTLNGISANVWQGRRGRVGYVRAMLQTLVEIFDYHLKYLERLRQERDKLQILQKILEQVEAARAEMEAFANRKCLFGMFGVDRRAYLRQEAYLEAVQAHARVIAEDMVLDVVRQTTADFRNIALQALQEVESWIQFLVTGDAVRGIRGLLPEIEQELSAIKALHDADRRMLKVHRLLDIQAYTREESVLQKALARIEWEISGEDFKIGCHLRIPVEVHENEHVRIEDRVIALSRVPEYGELENKRAFLQLASSFFRSWAGHHYVVDELLQHHDYRNPERLGAEMLEHDTPLLVRRPGTTTAHEAASLFIRVKREGLSPEVNRYIDALSTYVKENRAADIGSVAKSDIDVVESEDPYRIVLIRSQDNIRNVDFAAWHDLLKVYRGYLEKPGRDWAETGARLHIFPEEKHAAELEARLFLDLGQQPRLLHPRVVMLLGQKERLSLFFRAHALGMIRLHEDGIQRGVVLEIPDLSEKWQRYELVPIEERSEWPDIFILLDQFVLKGRDARVSKKQIPWERLHKAILREEQRLSKEGELEKLYRHSPLVQELRKKGQKMLMDYEFQRGKRAPAEWSWDPGQEYVDLADVGTLLLEDVLSSLESIY